MATINTRVKADAKEFRVEMKAVANAIKEMSAQIAKADETTGLFNKKVSKITGDFAHLTQGIAGSFAIVKDLNSLFGGVTSTFLNTADEIANLNSRLKLASASTAEYISQQKALLNIANASYSKH